MKPGRPVVASDRRPYPSYVQCRVGPVPQPSKGDALGVRPGCRLLCSSLRTPDSGLRAQEATAWALVLGVGHVQCKNVIFSAKMALFGEKMAFFGAKMAFSVKKLQFQ